MKRRNLIIISIIFCLVCGVFIATNQTKNKDIPTSQNEIINQDEEDINGIKIAFFDAKSYEEDAFTSSNTKYDYYIKYIDSRLTIETVELAKNFDFVCVFVNDVVNKEVINKLNEYSIKGIVLRCAGYDNVDLDAASKVNIPVLNVPSYSPNAIAEHTVALLLSLTRNIPEAVSRTREFNFDLVGLEGRNLNDLTIGIVGDGRIGRITAEIMSGFGMRVLVNARHPDEEWASSKGFTYVEKDTLFKESDVISLHCSLNESTYHLINNESLSLMKKDAILINTGRGALVDTEDLIEALENNKIGGAALDVYENEGEYFYKDYSKEGITDENLKKLLSLPNVIMTGHQAFLTDTALENIADTALANINAILNDLELENKVNY